MSFSIGNAGPSFVKGKEKMSSHNLVSVWAPDFCSSFPFLFGAVF